MGSICCKEKPKNQCTEEETKLGGIQDILSTHTDKLINKEIGMKQMPIQELLKDTEDSKFRKEKCEECNETSENLENSLITTYVDFDHNGVIYQTVLRKIKRIDAVFSDIKKKEKKSAQNIHIKSDEF